MSQIDLSKLPARVSTQSKRSLDAIFGYGENGDRQMQATVIALLAASLRNVIAVTGSTFTRPADTTAYASGDLVANSTTAGSVVPVSVQLARNSGTVGLIRRVRLVKSGTSVTNASFRAHFYSTSPTPANGDNGAWSTTRSGYLGSVDVTVDKAFTDAASGSAALAAGSELPVVGDADGTVFALIEARGAYTPTSNETFTLTVEGVQS